MRFKLTGAVTFAICGVPTPSLFLLPLSTSCDRLHIASNFDEPNDDPPATRGRAAVPSFLFHQRDPLNVVVHPFGAEYQPTQGDDSQPGEPTYRPHCAVKTCGTNLLVELNHIWSGTFSRGAADVHFETALPETWHAPHLPRDTCM